MSMRIWGVVAMVGLVACGSGGVTRGDRPRMQPDQCRKSPGRADHVRPVEHNALPARSEAQALVMQPVGQGLSQG